MPIAVSNQEALHVRGGLELFGGVELELDGAYTIAILKRKIQGQLEDIQTTQKALFDKYGQKDEQGKLIQTPAGEGRVTTALADPVGFAADWEKLMAKKQEHDVVPLTKAMLKGAKFKPDALFLLGPFFVAE